ncbi:sidestep VIII [Carabus blaptoides fortunei]
MATALQSILVEFTFVTVEKCHLCYCYSGMKGKALHVQAAGTEKTVALREKKDTHTDGRREKELRTMMYKAFTHDTNFEIEMCVWQMFCARIETGSLPRRSLGVFLLWFRQFMSVAPESNDAQRRHCSWVSRLKLTSFIKTSIVSVVRYVLLTSCLPPFLLHFGPVSDINYHTLRTRDTITTHYTTIRHEESTTITVTIYHSNYSNLRTKLSNNLVLYLSFLCGAHVLIAMVAVRFGDRSLISQNVVDKVVYFDHCFIILMVSEVEAVVGGVAKLPCDVTPPIAVDKVHLVIWYKEDADSPIYRCRVDFKKSPTRNTKVNLTVLIPPEKLSILDDQGTHIPHYILGPYNEGASIDITCVATGGRPTPRVTWWQENALLDDSFEVLTERRVRNVLHLEKLQRKHLHTVFTCQASNNQLVTPITSAVTLEMNLRPLWVKLLTENRPLSADNTYELSCEVVGSRPAPTITWWKGSVLMTNTRETVRCRLGYPFYMWLSNIFIIYTVQQENILVLTVFYAELVPSVKSFLNPEGNRTTSVLTFIPTIDDGGKFLSCRGVQPRIPESGKEDGIKLDIHHVPLVTLELGSNLNGSTIREGVDVYFECNIKSNPWVYKVSWRHNGKMLYNNAAAGTIVSNQSLVLQSVTRARAGLYTCVGSNQEGDGESNPVQLDVKFAPVCRPGQPKVFGVARQETARIPCELEANPQDVQFTWKFNNSGETIDIPQSHIATDRTRSIAAYTPMTELDYGTMLCWGKNEIGVQKDPCVYFVNPAGKPDSLQNCTILNQTAESLNVECIDGFDGGLPQEFVMEVYDTQTKKLVSNVTSRIPMFTVGGLESGLGFDIGLYAANKKGRSDVSRLQAFTLKSAEKHTDAGSQQLPTAPENCTLSFHSEHSVHVSCDVAEHVRMQRPTYLLQVYDAKSRLLLGTATSNTATDLGIDDLPAEPDGDGELLLFVRTMTSQSTSDAAILYTNSAGALNHHRGGYGSVGASTPVLLQITPILGALIGVVSALVMVAIVIVVVIRLRGGGDTDDKDCDDGGLSSTSRRCVAASGDKASTEPLNKDLNDSVDSLEEKNPDIIPQNNADDDYQDEERAFERLNNAPIRTYTRLQSPSNLGRNGSYDTYKSQKSNDEITYAELSLPNQQMPHVIYNQQAIPMSVMRRQEPPIVYAQIDVTKRMPCLQPLSPPHPPTLSSLHHPHLTAYLTRAMHEEQQQQHMQMHDGTGSGPNTPLISRDAAPLLDAAGSRTATLLSKQQTLPRTVTATRF